MISSYFCGFFSYPVKELRKTFLDHHVRDIVAVDFFMVPTATFRVLFCFVVLRNDRRFVVHFNVGAYITANSAASSTVKRSPRRSRPRFRRCRSMVPAD